MGTTRWGCALLLGATLLTVAGCTANPAPAPPPAPSSELPAPTAELYEPTDDDYFEVAFSPIWTAMDYQAETEGKTYTDEQLEEFRDRYQEESFPELADAVRERADSTCEGLRAGDLKTLFLQEADSIGHQIEDGIPIEWGTQFSIRYLEAVSEHICPDAAGAAADLIGELELDQ